MTYTAMNRFVEIVGTRVRYHRHATAVPLRDADDALHVNWCELTTTTAEGEIVC